MAWPPYPKDENPFKVVKGSSTIYPCQRVEGNHTLPEAPLTDEFEAFRTACLGMPPETAEEKYEPVVVLPGSDIRPHLHKDSNVTSSSRFMGLYISVAAIAGVGLMFLLGGRANNTSGNYTPPQQIYRSDPAVQQQAAQVEQPQNSRLPAFDTYDNQLKSIYNEFERSREPAFTPTALQPGLIHPAYESDAEAFALDLNGDNRNETLVRVNNGAFSFVFSPEGQEILHDNIMRTSDSSTNGYQDIFTTRNVTSDNGETTKFAIKYTYNGHNYVESARVMDQQDISTMARIVNDTLEKLSNPELMRLYLRNLEGDIGTHNALMAFLQSQAPPGVPLLTGSEYIEMLRLYDKENSTHFLDRYANDPAGFEHATLSHAYDSLFFDTSNPKGWFLIGASAAAKSIAKDLGMDSESQFISRIDRMEQGSGYVSAFRNSTGRNPTLKEWTNLRYRSNAIREDQLRTYGGESETIGTTRTNPDGSSQYIGNIYPGATAEQIRSVQAEQRRQEIQQQGRENWQAARADAQRKAQQAADAARKAIEKILPPPPPKKK